MQKKDIDTLGLTNEGRQMLESLHDAGIIKELSDGYRLAITLAIKRDLEPAPENIHTGTLVNVGSLDGDQTLRDLVAILRPESSDAPYRYIERLADAGLTELTKIQAKGQIRFADLFKEDLDSTTLNTPQINT